MKLVLSRQIFEKYAYIKFRKDSSSGSRVVSWGQTDRQTDRRDKANSRLSLFCEGALKRHTAHGSKGTYYASYPFKQVNLIVKVMN